MITSGDPQLFEAVRPCQELGTQKRGSSVVSREDWVLPMNKREIVDEKKMNAGREVAFEGREALNHKAEERSYTSARC